MPGVLAVVVVTYVFWDFAYTYTYISRCSYLGLSCLWDVWRLLGFVDAHRRQLHSKWVFLPDSGTNDKRLSRVSIAMETRETSAQGGLLKVQTLKTGPRLATGRGGDSDMTCRAVTPIGILDYDMYGVPLAACKLAE